MCAKTYLLGMYAVHLSSRGAWSGEELVDEETGELVLPDQLHRLHEVLHTEVSWSVLRDANTSGSRRVVRVTKHYFI